MTTRLATVIVLLLALQTATASQGPSADRTANPGSLRQIIPGHYVFTTNDEGRLFNNGVVATSERVVVFDALDSEAVARAERQAIAGVVKQPVRYLVSSVFHDPFSKGNTSTLMCSRSGMTILFVPQDRIAYMSEVFFNEEFPNVAGGYGVSWIRVLDGGEGARRRDLHTGAWANP